MSALAVLLLCRNQSLLTSSMTPEALFLFVYEGPNSLWVFFEVSTHNIYNIVSIGHLKFSYTRIAEIEKQGIVSYVGHPINRGNYSAFCKPYTLA